MRGEARARECLRRSRWSRASLTRARAWGRGGWRRESSLSFTTPCNSRPHANQ